MILGSKGQPAASQLQAAAGCFGLVQLADPLLVVVAAVVVVVANPVLPPASLKQHQQRARKPSWLGWLELHCCNLHCRQALLAGQGLDFVAVGYGDYDGDDGARKPASA